MKTTDRKSVTGNASKMQQGLAASLFAWMQRIALKGFGNLQRSRADRHMELTETLQLGGKRQLMLVICDGQRYLVASGGDSVNSIIEVHHPHSPCAAHLGMGESLSQLQSGMIAPDAICESGWSH